MGTIELMAPAADPWKPLVDEYFAWLRRTPTSRLENPTPATLEWVRNYLDRCAQLRKQLEGAV